MKIHIKSSFQKCLIINNLENIVTLSKKEFSGYSQSSRQVILINRVKRYGCLGLQFMPLPIAYMSVGSVRITLYFFILSL